MGKINQSTNDRRTRRKPAVPSPSVGTPRVIRKASTASRSQATSTTTTRRLPKRFSSIIGPSGNERSEPEPPPSASSTRAAKPSKNPLLAGTADPDPPAAGRDLDLLACAHLDRDRAQDPAPRLHLERYRAPRDPQSL